MAQAVERLTLDFDSGHDPTFVGSSPTSGSTKHGAHLRFSLFLCPSSSLMHSFKKKKNKHIEEIFQTSRNKFDNFDETDKLLGRQTLLKLTQEEI